MTRTEKFTAEFIGIPAASFLPRAKASFGHFRPTSSIPQCERAYHGNLNRETQPGQSGHAVRKTALPVIQISGWQRYP
jgi:hypothetical protein